MYKISVFLMALFIVSCSGEQGHQIKGGELTVYFFDLENEERAIDVAEFWRDNNLLTGKRQDLQLLFQDSTFVLKMIANKPTDAKEMSFKERVQLLKLQKEIADTIFHNFYFELWVCDTKFKPIYDINQ